MSSVVLDTMLEKMNKYLILEANEICINTPKELMIDRNSQWEIIRDEEIDEDFLDTLAIQLATTRRQQFDEIHCHLSCELPPPYLRYRIQVQHKATLFNSDCSVVIRIPSKTRFPLESFILSQKVTQAGWNYEKIKDIVKQQGEHKKNILISGGTGSGKTSFLNALIENIPLEERIISIEDSQELFIPHHNKVQLAVPKQESLHYNYEIAINNTMRMRPDRLFLGEIDTRNTFPFLRINNTGHGGSLSTLHANSPEDAIKAIITNIILRGSLQNPDRAMLIDYICTAIHYIVQIRRESNKRIITDILDLTKEKERLILEAKNG
ncbi:ATPase, T2SS/T4P/T4SS family [Helicobacter winghamensis]|uniref:ATPase, T2SS/T4P/T4SS family n=1 Tax=Helicobacter winghamensis TaxID=157268 RepID=UPI00279F308B